MNSDLHALRGLLCALQDTIRDTLLAARETEAAQQFADIAAETQADTIYHIDRVSEEAIVTWFATHWPDSEPVELVMEGLEDEVVTFPLGTPPEAARWTCILDPIDGTRNIMYDKRSAWSLAALAPRGNGSPTLRDIQIAAMTELPISKQWRADQISGVRGEGRDGLVAHSVDVRGGGREVLTPRPSTAADFKHGFAAISRFFPEGKSLLARVEEELWDALYGLGSTAAPLVFDDQYICTGGQIYELMIGHDRMLGDLRPYAFRKLGLNLPLVCHPYDICTAMLLQEAGGVIEAPDGSPLDAPLDTTSPIAWMGYANEQLAATVRPILQRLMERHFS